MRSAAERHSEEALLPPDESSPLLGEAQTPSNDELAPELLADGGLFSECVLICQQSFPLIITYLLQYSATLITTIAAGHLTSNDLGAASIGLTTMNIIGYALVEGMATALDTVCAQAYGSGQVTHVGLHVQRMLALMTLAIIPIGVFWVFSPLILPLVIKQHELAVQAGIFLQVSLIGLPGYAFFEAGKRFMQAQGDFTSGTAVLVITTPINALLTWYFTMVLDLGLPGAALAQAIANNLRPLLLLGHIVFFAPWSLKCWGGWSRDALDGWGHLLSLSVAGTAVNLAEWGAFEILMVSTTYIDTNHLAAQTILSTVSVITWHIPFSISVAVSTRIGVFLGAGYVLRAQRAAAMYSLIFLVVGVADGLAIYFLRDYLTPIFSNDEEVVRIAINSTLGLALFQIVDALSSGCNGVLRGLGCQSVAAWIVLAINYLGAVPLAIWLEIGPPDLKLGGLWYGLGSGMVFIVLIEIIYMRWINWEDRIYDIRVREGAD
ncbi:unnamed protein product [Clonostachys solani]|uniref:Uncharacterized protein n=1 Tax=Clonostachys solani TaxID=160281 RepID=A0A9N9W044_9HYPO|nr:unnamed protein product [Clonostachys solani]